MFYRSRIKFGMTLFLLRWIRSLSLSKGACLQRKWRFFVGKALFSNTKKSVPWASRRELVCKEVRPFDRCYDLGDWQNVVLWFDGIRESAEGSAEQWGTVIREDHGNLDRQINQNRPPYRIKRLKKVFQTLKTVNRSTVHHHQSSLLVPILTQRSRNWNRRKDGS